MTRLGYIFSDGWRRPKPGKYVLYSWRQNKTRKSYVLYPGNNILSTDDISRAHRFTYLGAKRMQSGKLRLKRVE